MSSLLKPSETVKVAVRLRPFNLREKDLGSKSCITLDTSAGICTVKMEDSSQDRSFKFDTVFDEQSSQVDIFNTIGKPIVDSVMQGYNGTVFAYGHNCAGKTYTMEGFPESQELSGLITRCFNYIFDTIDASTDGTEYSVRVSILEIYNEQIHDLLGKDPEVCLELKSSQDKEICVKDLSSIIVARANDIAPVLRTGKLNRVVPTMAMNSASCSSHSITTITVESSNGNQIKVGKLTLVDLAGSERTGKAGARGDRMKDGIGVNKSLSTLVTVISSLAGSKLKHVPFRDSKLTRLLQNSLGGNAQTVMIANISPADLNKDETLNTLKHASKAKKIQNKPIVNTDPKDSMLRTLQSENKKQIV